MAPSKKRQYTPLTPSPLNPNPETYRSSDLDRTSYHSKTTTSPSHRQTLNPNRQRNYKPNRSPPDLHNNNNNNNLSPTQYLLRQKAALAWRSATVHHHVLLVSVTPPILSPLLSQPYLASDLVESPLVRNGKVVGSVRNSDGGDWSVARHVRFADVDEGGEGGDIGLGIGIASKGVGISMDAGDGRWGAAENGEGRGMEGLPLLAAEPVPEAEPGRGQKGVRPVRDGSRVGVTVRRVFAVLGLIVGLGLIHGLVEAFGGMGRETRPRPPGPAGTWSGKV